MTERGQEPQGSQELWYILLAVLVAVLSLAGYLGYVLYPRFDLPAATGVGLLVLAAGAGIASFFSPCSFPLLVTLLAQESGSKAGQPDAPMQRTFASATALALGATLFLILTGIGVALGASELFEGVTFTSTIGRIIRLAIGTLLILLGLIQFGLIPTSFDAAHAISTPVMRKQARLRREHPTLGFGLFGFIYILAGFGWTGPILAGLVGYALTVGGVLASLAAFGVAGLVIVLLIFGLALAIGLAQGQFIAKLRAEAPRVKRWGGVVLVVVGLWTIAIGIWAEFFSRFFPV